MGKMLAVGERQWELHRAHIKAVWAWPPACAQRTLGERCEGERNEGISGNRWLGLGVQPKANSSQ